MIFKFEIVTKIIYITNGGITLETVELRFQYTQSEYIKAERQYLISSKTIHKYDIALVAVFLLLSVIYMLFSSFSVFSILIDNCCNCIGKLFIYPNAYTEIQTNCKIS